MTDKVKRTDYFSLEVPDQPGEAFKVFDKLKKAGINLVSCSGFPATAGKGQITLVPSDADAFLKAVKGAGLSVGARKQALFVQGSDRVGAVAEVLKKLAEAKINVTAYNASSTQGGEFGMVLWVRPNDLDAAAKALGV